MSRLRLLLLGRCFPRPPHLAFTPALQVTSLTPPRPQPQKTLDAVLEYVAHGGAMTEATGGSTAVAAPVAIDDPHASEEAAKLAEPEHFPGHVG
jgi:hypothetical protein